jgi:glycosyltransferase involved in cell wall biosynthesis
MSVKICFIASHFPQGGAERQIMELIKGLICIDYEITLILYQSDMVFYKELLNLNVTLIVNKKKSNRFKLIRWIQNIIFLNDKLKKGSFDIIHTYLFYNGFIVRIFAPKKFNNRIVYSIRNSYESVSKIFFFLDKLLNKKSVNIYNSKKSFLELYNKPSKSILGNNFIIYNGFDLNIFNPKGKISSELITIGMVGRMTIQKNHIQVLRVMHSLYNQLFKLYIIGDSNLDEGINIKNFVITHNLTDNVILLDAQKNIEDYYKRFDIFILSSLYEGCPNALFEALLSKCLCIVSEGANSDYFIKDGFNGLVYDGTDEMLKLKIKEGIGLFKNGIAKDIISNGYNYAISNFSIGTMIKSYDNIYKNYLLRNE